MFSQYMIVLFFLLTMFQSEMYKRQWHIFSICIQFRAGTDVENPPENNIKWCRRHSSQQSIIVCLIGVMTYLHPPPPPAHSSSLLLPSV